MTWGPIQLRNRSNRKVLFTGEASPAPGGGSIAVRSLYNGDPVTIFGSGGGGPTTANLTFDSLDDGPELFDRTDPAQPVFLAAGTYAVTVNWIADAPPDLGGVFNVGLYVDQAVTTATLTTAVSSVAVAPAQSGPALTAIAVVEAGDYLFVAANNFGSVGSRDFTIYDVAVTKLS